MVDCELSPWQLVASRLIGIVLGVVAVALFTVCAGTIFSLHSSTGGTYDVGALSLVSAALT